MSKWHGGKGSKRRPEDLQKIADNWDKIFGKKDEDLAYESGNPLERPYDPGINSVSNDEDTLDAQEEKTERETGP